MTDSAHEQAVTSVEDALATGRLEMAGLRVAVLRSESESIHNPAWDPVPVIEEDLGWRVEIFVERDFRALLDVDYEFDCILIGHNALFRRREVADAMSRHRFRAGVVILQQRFIDGGLDLGNGLSLKVQDLARPVSRVTIARGRPADREVLLNWPCPLRDLDSEFRCEALRGFVLPETAPWRVILEGRSNGRLMPVLIRAPPSAATRVVATSLLLERHNDAHVKLLRNIVTLAAAGPPQTVVEAQDSAWRGTVARKLRLRGVAAVAIEPEPEFGNRWRFDSWPYVGVTDVFVEGRDVGDLAKVLEREEVAAWLRRGGRLAVVDELGRTNTFFHGSEVDWVARRFIGQLQVAGPAWRKSILSLRAVLRLMGHLWRLEPEDRLARFGVPTAQELREAARARRLAASQR